MFMKKPNLSTAVFVLLAVPIFVGSVIYLLVFGAGVTEILILASLFVLFGLIIHWANKQ